MQSIPEDALKEYEMYNFLFDDIGGNVYIDHKYGHYSSNINNTDDSDSDMTDSQEKERDKRRLRRYRRRLRRYRRYIK